MFLPTTKPEMSQLGWTNLDVIIVTGDAYIDSSYIGAAVIGKWLLKAGYRVGIIAQPDINDPKDISRLGEPSLFWGVTGGCVDSMVSNYTATKKKRNQDDFTPGGVNDRRPDRAVMAYCNLIRRNFKNTKPLIIGGLEASLRRIAHYDYWDNSIRRSILIDSKADILVYGMGERQVLDIAEALKSNKDFHSIRGICYAHKNSPPDYLELPSFQQCRDNKTDFIRMFHLFYENNDPLTAKTLCQKTETGPGENDYRYLIQNPPAMPLLQEELDSVYEMDFERDVHPQDKKLGEVRALETIRFSLTTHRGCYGECNFCSIAVHQGNVIRERSEESILREAAKIASFPGFKGYILDAGGPTANMYGTGCTRNPSHCRGKRCLYPVICPNLKVSHRKQISLLKKIREIPSVKKVFVSSGVRYDIVLSDNEFGNDYMEELVQHHVSGQMKIAPEHSEPKVLSLMGKNGNESLITFKKKFDELNRKSGKEQFLTYYFIAAHPGCGISEMRSLKDFIRKELQIRPEQVQIFMPTPATYSTLSYYTETNPFTGEKIFVEKDKLLKERQKNEITAESNTSPVKLPTVRRGSHFHGK